MGIVEVMTVARSFLGVVLVQGLDAAWFRLRFEREGEELKRFESTVVWYLIACSAGVMALLAVFGDELGAVLTPGIPFVPLGLWSAATACSLIFAALLERRLQAEQRPLAFALFSLARTAATLASIIVFVAVLRRGAAGKIQGEALSALAAAVFAIAVLAPGVGASLGHLKKALRYGWPLLPHAIAGLVNDQIDRFVLNAILGLHAVGVYSMGYRLAGVAMTMMIAQNQAFSPVFIETLQRAARADEAGKDDEARSLKGRVASLGFLNVLVGSAIAQVVAAGARELLLLATTAQFEDSWKVVAPVAAGVVSWTWYATLSQSVTFRTETVHRLPFITIGAALVNLATNLLLVPHFGIEGAAWATFVSNTAMAAGAYYFGTKSVPLPYAFRRWAVVSAWTGLSLVLIWQLDAHVGSFAVRVAGKALWLVASATVTLRLSGVRARTLVDSIVRRTAP